MADQGFPLRDDPLWVLSVRHVPGEDLTALKNFFLNGGETHKEEGERGDPLLTGGFLWALNLVPLSWRIFFFENWADSSMALDDRHRRIALRNLAWLSRKKALKEREALPARLSATWDGWLRIYLQSPAERKEYRPYVSFEGLENSIAPGKKGKGFFFSLALTELKMDGRGVSPLFGHPSYVVFRPMDSRFLDESYSAPYQHRQPVDSQAEGHGTDPPAAEGGKTLGICWTRTWPAGGGFCRFFRGAACTNIGMASWLARPAPRSSGIQRPGQGRAISGDHRARDPLDPDGNKDDDVLRIRSSSPGLSNGISATTRTTAWFIRDGRPVLAGRRVQGVENMGATVQIPWERVRRVSSVRQLGGDAVMSLPALPRYAGRAPGPK